MNNKRESINTCLSESTALALYADSNSDWFILSLKLEILLLLCTVQEARALDDNCAFCIHVDDFNCNSANISMKSFT